MSGDFHGRREDKRLVTGQGKYTSDWNFPDQTYAHFLRADRGHAEILGLDLTEALASPGVLAIITGADTTAAGYGPAPNMVKFPGKGGSKMKPVPREVLAHKKVVFVGQEVALVVATTALEAQDAAERIVVDYRDLPAVIDAEAAMEPGAPVLYPELGDNLAFDFEYGDQAGTDEAFARAAHVTRLVLDAPRIVGNPMEPKAALVTYDAARDIYDVYSPSQGITGLRSGLSVGTGVPEEKLRCHAHDVGGGFGIRGEAYTEYLTLMLAAKKVGKPVKWVASRTETFVSDHHGRGAKLFGELALDKDGKFTAMRVTWWINAGGYLSTPGAFTNTLAPSGNITSIYKIPVAHGLHRVILTNTTPTTPYRGAARPNVSYLIERLVDEAALKLGIDRVDLRRRNLIASSEFPFKTATGATYDSGDPHGLLEDVLKHSDFSGFPARKAASKAAGKLRGISCCIFIEPSGGGSSPNEETFIKFGDSGNPVLYTVSGPSGQGHETVFPEIVGREFGIAPENITLRFSDPDGPPLQGDGTIGSRSLMSHGGSLMLAAREVVKKGRDLAATHLEAAVEDIEFTEGAFRVKGTDLSITLLDLARKYAGKDVNPLDTKYGLPAPRAFPTGAHVAEVEVDAATGDVELISYVGVDDCGNVINHALAEGQVHGGLMQGFGQVFDEVCIYDASGQMLTASFMDYCMPRAHELKGLRLYDRPVPSPSNPLGAKGVGEAGATGSVPTLACAVLDALREVGVKRLDLPYTPSRVWGAIRDARG